MSYVRKVLLPGEQVIYETGLHWLIYGRAIVLFAAAVVLAAAMWLASPDPLGTLWSQIGLCAAAVLALFALTTSLVAGIRRVTTELAVTNQRVIYKRGVFARYTIEMNRSKVESVDVDQSVFGRILGYGTLVVRGTGGSLEPVESISHPLTFRSHITAEPVQPMAAHLAPDG